MEKLVVTLFFFFFPLQHCLTLGATWKFNHLSVEKPKYI